MSTVPCETESPTPTRSSETVPAVGAGTPMVALSDSRVTNGSSTATTSPELTWISITCTSLKSPMSGTGISTALMFGSSRLAQQKPAVVFEEVTQLPGEPRGQRAIDHPVVIRQRNRQHHPGDELRSAPDRRHLGAHHAENRSLGGVDDRRK